MQPESRECFERLLSQGWTDALRRIYGDERVYTFWDYFRQHWQTDSGLRIDHLLLSPDVATRLKTAGVSKWVRGQPHASDHAPTWVELGPPKRTRRAKAGGADQAVIARQPDSRGAADARPAQHARRRQDRYL